MSFIHNNSYNSLKKSGRSNAARHLERKVFQVHRITKYQSELRLFSVAINSLGTDGNNRGLIKRESYKRFQDTMVELHPIIVT